MPNLTINQPKPNTNYSHIINFNRRVRRAKSNPTSKNHSILINRTHRMNDSSITIQHNHNNLKPTNLHHNNTSNIHTINPQLSNHNFIPIPYMKQNTRHHKPNNSNPTLNRRPASTIRIYAKMNNYSRNNKKWKHHHANTHSNNSTAKPLFLHTTSLLLLTDYVPIHQQHKNKMTIRTHKTNKITSHNNCIINTSPTYNTSPLVPKLGI